jgi:hypothetical protein
MFLATVRVEVSTNFPAQGELNCQLNEQDVKVFNIIFL